MLAYALVFPKGKAGVRAVNQAGKIVKKRVVFLELAGGKLEKRGSLGFNKNELLIGTEALRIRREYISAKWPRAVSCPRILRIISEGGLRPWPELPLHYIYCYKIRILNENILRRE